MALRVAIALFVAQAINFGLLLHERQRFRFEQVTAPAITRMTDAIERARTRPDLTFDRGRVRFEPHNPITPAMQPLPDVEQAIRDTLVEAGQTAPPVRSEEPTSELQSLMRISYAVSCLTETNHDDKT